MFEQYQAARINDGDDLGGGIFRFVEPAYKLQEIFIRQCLESFKKLLVPFDWGQRNEKAQKENLIAELDRQDQELRRRPKTLKERREELWESYRRHEEDRLEFLHFRYEQAGPQFFKRLHLEHKGLSVPGYISEMEVKNLEKKMVTLPDEISEKDRDKILAKHDAEREGLRVWIGAYNDPKYFRDTLDGKDCRELFLRMWIETQTSVKAACNAFGTALKRCPRWEQEAHAVLNLKRFINPNGLEPC